MGLYFSISALLILLIFAITFFMKQRVKNDETEIYKYLLLITMLGLTLEISTAIMYNVGVDINSIFYQLLSKMVFCYYLVWSYFFAKYIISICKNKSKTKTFILFLTLISSVLVMVSPISYIEQGNVIMPDGLSLYITYLVSIIYIFIDLFYCIKYRKKIVGKKFAPLYIFFALAIFSFIIQVIFPDLFLLGYIFSYDIMVMHFTIENPDVKMINELEYAKNTAEKANRAKSDFLSSMSHEIRTPLNAIVGLSECIKNSDDIEEIHEDANDVVMASNNLLEIVNGILDISKIEADKMEIIESNYNPIEVFKELTTIAETRIADKEIELRCNFAEDLPNTLFGDKGKLKQIITNMLSNAAKYTEKGYIDFNVSCINEKDKCKLQIIISDTGRGIKPEQIDKIFNKFERAEEDKNSTIEGTGLGLAITKSLVEMMGGKILVHSTYGEGSKFTVFLEQKYSKGEETTKVVKDEKVSYSDKKVLIVDDNKLNIKVASKVLSEFELNIDSADSGFSAIEKIENNERYDIIFMDIMMPKMSGVETLKKLKEIDGFFTPVVALTADAMEGKSTKYIEVGFNDYLSKPINKEELKRVLNKCLNNNNKIVEEKIVEEDPDIHKVIPITDEQIEELNRLFGPPTLISEDRKKEKENSKNNINYLKDNDIDVDSSIELLGDLEMYNETLKTFIEENKSRIPRIKDNKEKNNMKDYSVDVHALKSDCKYLGFRKLAEIAYNHELKSKDNDVNYVKEKFDELMNEYNRISDIINKYL